MQFTATKQILLPALNRLCAVSKNEYKNFSQLGLTSIKAEKDHVLLSASNGYIKVVQELKDENLLKIIKDGETIVDSFRFRDIIKSVPDDSGVKLTLKGENLVRDIMDRKRMVHIPTVPGKADVEVKDIDSKNQYSIESSVFSSSLFEVVSFAGKEDYREQYHQVYVDFMSDQTRFVCGDGGFFILLINTSDSNANKIKGGEHKGYIIPAPQASILAGLFDETKNVNITFTPSTYRFDTDSGLTVVLDGIPLDYAKYVPYEEQWRRMEEKSVLFTLSSTSMEECVADMNAIRDIEWEKKNNCTAVTVICSKDEITFKSETKYGLECSFEPEKFESKEEKTSLDFSAQTFIDLMKIGKNTTYEFSLLSDLGFCRFLSDPENRQRIMFFAKVIETDL